MSTRSLVKLAQDLITINSKKKNKYNLISYLLSVVITTLRSSCLRFLISEFMSTPTTELFMYGGKQNIIFFILLCSNICFGFFNVYANFYQNSSPRNGYMCVVSIIFEHRSYIRCYINFCVNI